MSIPYMGDFSHIGAPKWEKSIHKWSELLSHKCFEWYDLIAQKFSHKFWDKWETNSIWNSWGKHIFLLAKNCNLALQLRRLVKNNCIRGKNFILARTIGQESYIPKFSRTHLLNVHSTVNTVLPEWEQFALVEFSLSKPVLCVSCHNCVWVQST